MIILAILVIGMASGWVAQLVLGRPTTDRAEALVAGLIGSLVGGLIASLIAGDGFALRLSGIIGSIVGAVIVLATWAAISGRRRRIR
jgi:uncharacterized membrane protein YeaQ/YmgE (transglycosylase-associated protein family)